MPGRISLYLDESGNTGTNFLDDAQPIYALAGWVVPEELREAAQRVIVESCSSIATPELKGSQLLRHTRGRTLVTELLEELLQLGCMPVFSVMEKRYAVVGKIIETFLDPPYNPRASNRFTWDTDLKQGIAERLYRLPGEGFGRLWDLIRRPDIEEADEWEAALRAVVVRLMLLGLDDLAQLFEGALGHIDDVIRDLVSVDSDPVQRHVQGLDATMLAGVAGDVDAIDLPPPFVPLPKPESTDGLGCAGCRARNGRFGGCGSGWWRWQGATVAVRACGQEETAVGRRSQACWRQAVERSARPSGVRSGAGSPAAGRGRR